MALRVALPVSLAMYPFPRQENQSMPPRVEVNYEGGRTDPATGKTLYGTSFIFFFNRRGGTVRERDEIAQGELNDVVARFDKHWANAGFACRWASSTARRAPQAVADRHAGRQ
jgi:hypothetical protein